jgi:SMC interacting uncharacterized protein involved in chromosome segregation
MNQPRDLEYEAELKERRRRGQIQQLRKTIEDRDREIQTLKAEITRLTAPKPTPKQRAERSGIHG